MNTEDRLKIKKIIAETFEPRKMAALLKSIAWGLSILISTKVFGLFISIIMKLDTTDEPLYSILGTMLAVTVIYLLVALVMSFVWLIKSIMISIKQKAYERDMQEMISANEKMTFEEAIEELDLP